MDTTIIYYTDNQLDPVIFDLCSNNLKRTGFPIVSVSHEPIALGENICVGKQKRCWLTLYRQLKAGLEAAQTKYVAMAEHDCLYTAEHFGWRPPKGDTFYYNENVWLVQWGKQSHPELNGMYSRYWKQRLALSQLVCSRELMLQSVDAKLEIIDRGHEKAMLHIGEPGVTRARTLAESGRPAYLKKYMQCLDKEKYDVFRTERPNLDIRHDKNFTGPKRGRKRRFKIKYWGRFQNLIDRYANKREK